MQSFSSNVCMTLISKADLRNSNRDLQKDFDC